MKKKSKKLGCDSRRASDGGSRSEGARGTVTGRRRIHLLPISDSPHPSPHSPHFLPIQRAPATLLFFLLRTKCVTGPAPLPPPGTRASFLLLARAPPSPRLLPPPGTCAAVPAPPSSSWHPCRRPRTSFLLLARAPPPQLLAPPAMRAAAPTFPAALSSQAPAAAPPTSAPALATATSPLARRPPTAPVLPWRRLQSTPRPPLALAATRPIHTWRQPPAAPSSPGVGHRQIFSMLLHHSGGKEATVTTPTYFFLCCYIAGPNCGEDAVLGVWQVVCVHANWRLCVCRVHQVGSQCTRE
ncbi:hypothetical protein VPH35_013959 [Triticum aestivum]